MTPPEQAAQQPGTLDYATPTGDRSRNGAAWAAAVMTGVSVGFGLGVSSEAIAVSAVVAGALIGILTASLAKSNKVWFGLVGNAVATVTCVATVSVHELRLGDPIDFVQRLELGAMLFGLLAVPGVIGSGLVWLNTRFSVV